MLKVISKPKLIIETYRGDPILSLAIHEHGCMSGTVLGRVCLYPFDIDEVPSANLFGDNFTDRENTSLGLNNSKEGLNTPHTTQTTLSENAKKYTSDFNSTHKITSQSESLDLSDDEHSKNDSNYTPHDKPENNARKNTHKHKLTQLLSIITHIKTPKDVESERRKCKVLSSFNNDAIKFVYLNSSHAYAILDNCQYIIWNLKNYEQKTMALQDWKFKNDFKELMHNSGTLLIITNQRSLVIDLNSNIQKSANFLLFDRDLCLLDFNSQFVLCLVKSPNKIMILYVVELAVSFSGRFHESFASSLKNSFKIELPSKMYISTACFWNPGRIVLAANAKELRVFDINSDSTYKKLKGHKSDVIALDGSSSDLLISLSKDQIIKVWSSETWKCVKTYSVKPAKFTLGWNYYIRRSNDIVVFSSDQGIFWMRLKV